MLPERLDGVLRATRDEAAPARSPAPGQLIAPDRPHHRPHRQGRGLGALPVRGRIDHRRAALQGNGLGRGHRTAPCAAAGRSADRRVACSNARLMATFSSSNASWGASRSARTRYAPAGRDGAWPTRIDRSRRRSRFLVTAFPTCRLMANATSRPDQVLCLTKATDSGPARPRSRVRRSASKVCRDRTAPSGVPPGPEGLTAITPTGDDVPSPGATGSPPGRPWSTSACGSHVSSPACARWVDRFVSSIHFLPLPEPSTWRRVRQGARSHRDQGIPLHARRESTPALVEPREARSVVTVYRSEQRKQRTVVGVGPGAPPRLPDERRRTTRRNGAPPPILTGRTRPSVLVHSCGYLCGPTEPSKGGGPRERH